MWSLITISSASHLHRDNFLAGASTSRPAAPGASICVTDSFYIYTGLHLTTLGSGREQSFLTRLTQIKMNNKRSILCMSLL